jgi:integrase
MRGSITRRGDAWMLKVEQPRRTDGRRKYAYDTVHGPKKAAERRLAEMVHEIAGGSYFEPTKMSVGEFLDQWLGQTAGGLTARTRERYRSIIDNHLKPALGHHPLAKLTPMQIQAHYSQALKNGRDDGTGALSPATVLKAHHILHRALRQAVRWQLIARNPADAVEPPRALRTEMRALDSAQTATLLAAAADTRLAMPILLAVSTGMRRGELLGLRWSDVDLVTGTVAVRQTINETSEGIAFAGPKTAKSRRVLPIGATTVAALKRHRADQDGLRLGQGSAYHDADLVFCLPDGSPWSPSAFSLAFMRLLRKTELPQIRFHDLRHTHASQLLAQGVHPKIVSERLGHANIGITLDTYSHVLPGLQQEAVAAFDQALRASMDVVDAAATNTSLSTQTVG